MHPRLPAGLPDPGPRPGRAVDRIARRGSGQRGHPGREDPARGPRANASEERYVLTARTKVADRMLIFGERHLRLVMAELCLALQRTATPSQPRTPPTSARPPRRRHLPEADQTPVRAQWPRQRIRTRRVEVQIKAGGRVLQPQSLFVPSGRGGLAEDSRTRDTGLE